MSIERVRLQPYVDAPLARQLAAYSAATGKTTSFVVQVALRQYLDRSGSTSSVVRGTGPSATSRSTWRHLPST